MPDDVTTTPLAPGSPAAGGGVPSSAPAAPAIDPAEYEALKTFYAQAAPVIQSLEPLGEDISWLQASDENREFIRSARKTYEEQRRAREPQLDANGQLLLDRFKPVLEFVDELKTREKTMTQRQIDEHNRKVRSEADALVAKDPRLAHNNRALLTSVANYGDARGISSLTEAYNEWSKDIGGSATPTPPRSLRGEAAAAGVPGPSTAPPIKGPKDIRARLRTAFAAQRG